MLDAISEFFRTYLQGTWTSLIDILLVALVIYGLFVLIRGTRAVRIVIGLSILYLVYLGARLVGLELLTRLGAGSAPVASIVALMPCVRKRFRNPRQSIPTRPLTAAISFGES